MNMIGWAIIFWLVLPHSTCKADMPPSLAASNFDTSTAKTVALPDKPKIKDFENICNAVSNAGRLDDLKPILTDKKFEFLKAKITPGVSQYVVLAKLQAMRPQKIRIIDSRIKKGQAEFTVTGHSILGLMQGKIHMVKEDVAWKIEEETWSVSQSPDHKNSSVIMVFKSLSDVDQYVDPKQKGPGSKGSSKGVIQKAQLPLTKIDNNRRKEAVMFVFPMNEAKADPDQVVVRRDNTRGRVHVMGPKKIFKEQKTIENKYPVDITVSKYDDGFAPREWNVVLPSGKPHEVTVSWLWSF